MARPRKRKAAPAKKKAEQEPLFIEEQGEVTQEQIEKLPEPTLPAVQTEPGKGHVAGVFVGEPGGELSPIGTAKDMQFTITDERGAPCFGCKLMRKAVVLDKDDNPVMGMACRHKRPDLDRFTCFR